MILLILLFIVSVVLLFMVSVVGPPPVGTAIDVHPGIRHCTIPFTPFSNKDQNAEECAILLTPLGVG